MGCSNNWIYTFSLLAYIILGTFKYTDSVTCITKRDNICYFFANASADWQNAGAACTGDSNIATLPSIKDSATQVFINELLINQSSENVWLPISGSQGNWYYVSDKSDLTNQGCYKDISFKPDLSGYNETINDLVPSICVTKCSDKGFKYAGVRSRTNCSCGDSYGKYGIAKDNECVVSCAGDDTLYCGGWGSNDIYLVNGAYSNWGYLQPKKEECGALLSEANERKFGTLTCTSSLRYICQIGGSQCPSSAEYSTIDNVCIFISTASFTFSAAQAECKKINGDLIKIKDAALMSNLRAELLSRSTVDMYWIGLTKYMWKFEDGSEATYQPWASLQPNLTSLTSACVAMSKTDAYTWKAEDCTKNLPVLCELDTNLLTTTMESSTVTTTVTTATTTVTTAAQDPTAANDGNNSGNNGNDGNNGNNGNNSGNDGNNSGSPSSGASTGSTSNGIKGYQIAIIIALVVLCVIILIVIILVLVQKKKSNNSGRVSPDSMARNSPLPPDDNDTAGLVVTDRNMFNPGGRIGGAH